MPVIGETPGLEIVSGKTRTNLGDVVADLVVVNSVGAVGSNAAGDISVSGIVGPTITIAGTAGTMYTVAVGY